MADMTRKSIPVTIRRSPDNAALFPASDCTYCCMKTPYRTPAECRVSTRTFPADVDCKLGWFEQVTAADRIPYDEQNHIALVRKLNPV